MADLAENARARALSVAIIEEVTREVDRRRASGELKMVQQTGWQQTWESNAPGRSTTSRREVTISLPLASVGELDKWMHELPEFKQLEQLPGIPALQTAFQAIVWRALYGLLNEDAERRTLAMSLLDQLEHKPTRMEFTAELVGVLPDGQSTVLQHGDIECKLRRVETNDLNWTRGMLQAPSIFENRAPSAILSGNLLGTRLGDPERAIGLVTCLLRLFGASETYCQRFWTEPFMLCTSHVLAGDWPPSALGPIGMKPVKAEELKAFWQAVVGRLPEPMYWRGFRDEPPSDPLSLAYERFCEATLHLGAPERQISSAVMGLESLLLTERDELRFRISIRAARLMSVLGYSGTSVFEAMKAAYDVRSKFLHGSAAPRTAQMRQLAPQILEILRTSILLLTPSVGESPKSAKSRIVNLVDDAVKDHTLHSALEAWAHALPSAVVSRIRGCDGRVPGGV